jgi:hypothetical protein
MIFLVEIVLSDDKITNVIFVLLITLISFLLIQDRKMMRERLDKNENWLLSQQKEVNELSKQTSSAIKLLEANQKNDSRRLDIMQNIYMRNADLSVEILDKLKALQGK